MALPGEQENRDRGAVVWLRLDELDDVGSLASDIGDLERAHGAVLNVKQLEQLPGIPSVCRVDSPSELCEQLENRQDVFVPAHLTEAVWAGTPISRSFEGEIWLADHFAARHQLARSSPPFAAASLGLVGAAPHSGGVPVDRYALLCDAVGDRKRIHAALCAGVRTLWLHPDLRVGVAEQLRIVAGLEESAEIGRLFAGMSPEELEQVWERRLCLVARRDLPAGHVIAGAEFELRPSEGGISADLLEALQGVHLRYDVGAGVAVTFGDLDC